MIQWLLNNNLPSCGQPNVGDPCPAIMAIASQAEYPHTFRMVPNIMCTDESLDHCGCLPLQLHNLLFPDFCEFCIIQVFLKVCGCLNLKQSHSTSTLRDFFYFNTVNNIPIQYTSTSVINIWIALASSEIQGGLLF